jgi:hypothetical protein
VNPKTTEEGESLAKGAEALRREPRSPEAVSAAPYLCKDTGMRSRPPSSTEEGSLSFSRSVRSPRGSPCFVGNSGSNGRGRMAKKGTSARRRSTIRPYMRRAAKDLAVPITEPPRRGR